MTYLTESQTTFPRIFILNLFTEERRHRRSLWWLALVCVVFLWRRKKGRLCVAALAQEDVDLDPSTQATDVGGAQIEESGGKQIMPELASSPNSPVHELPGRQNDVTVHKVEDVVHKMDGTGMGMERDDGGEPGSVRRCGAGA